LNFATKLRPLTVGLVRSLPEMRGRGTFASAINAALLRAGAEPIALSKMRGGYSLFVDCRLFSHAHALFSGEYDDDKIGVLLKMLSPGGVALDVGANIGFYTVPMAVLAARIGARVVAVEPLQSNISWLRRNLALNDVAAHVTILELGLSSERSDTDLLLREDFLSGASVGNASIAEPGIPEEQFKRVRVRLDTLDSVWPSLGNPRLDVVKLDIEGHEDRFFEGGKEILFEHRPTFLIEVNRWFYRRRDVDFDTRIPQLLPPDYQVFEVARAGITRRASLSDVGEADALLIPAEKAQAFRP
jgi:FkbM family methyltransferase